MSQKIPHLQLTPLQPHCPPHCRSSPSAPSCLRAFPLAVLFPQARSPLPWDRLCLIPLFFHTLLKCLLTRRVLLEYPWIKWVLSFLTHPSFTNPILFFFLAFSHIVRIHFLALFIGKCTAWEAVCFGHCHQVPSPKVPGKRLLTTVTNSSQFARKFLSFRRKIHVLEYTLSQEISDCWSAYSQ